VIKLLFENKFTKTRLLYCRWK